MCEIRAGRRCVLSGQGAMWMRAAVRQDPGYCAVSEPLMHRDRPGTEGRAAGGADDFLLPAARSRRDAALLTEPPAKVLSAAGRRVPGPQSSVSPPVHIWTRTRLQ